MEPLTFLSLMAGISMANNLCDYVAFSRKHRETQEGIVVLQREVTSLNRTLDRMAIELKENNKIIKNLENTTKETKT
jgi:hypothetical protein